MASQKRKARSDDFFYYTLEDEEVLGDADKPVSKKAKKADAVDEEDEGDDEFDPGFEFFDGGSDIGFEDEEEAPASHGLELKGAERIVDLNELIKQRRERKEEEAKKEAEKKEKKEKKASAITSKDDEDDEEDEDEDVDFDDADDEVLAADGFGMGADSDEEEEEEEETEGKKGSDEEEGSEKEDEEDEDEDDAASDNDSVATPVGHPDDNSRDDDASSVSSDEDMEERARQEEYFAAGEKEKKKSGSGKGANGGANGSDKTAMSFQAMRLFSRPILRGIAAAGFDTPTQIQAKTIPFGIGGHDVVGQAVTGSGKTAAFLLPILERLLHRPTNVPKTRVVILTPTRELAVQCHKVAVKLAAFTPITMALTVGGTSFKSSEASLRSRPDIVIGTPGRFIDHMRNSPSFAVDGVEILVLDEADRMLQDGFADELNEIVQTLPRGRQTLLFSATMGASVDQLIRVGLSRPVRIQADDKSRTAGTLTQAFVRLRQGREDRRLGYLVELCTTLYRDHAIIFFREKRSIHEARIVFGLLGLTCEELHGNIKQAERIASLESFRRGEVQFLLASDLASRGLDIKGVETVINYEVPKNLDDYIHRIGRTARAGRRGLAVTIVSEKDRKFVKEVVKAMRAGGDKEQKEKKGKTVGETGLPMPQQVRIRSQQVDPAAADRWQAKIDAMAEDVAEIVAEERQVRAMAQAEMEVTRGENLLKHRDEIMARPKRTWFESGRDKEAKRQLQRREAQAERSDETKKSTMERLRDQLKAKHGGSGWLSRKDTKKLDAKKDRLEGLGGRKLKQEKKELGASGNNKARGKVIKGGSKKQQIQTDWLESKARSASDSGFTDDCSRSSAQAPAMEERGSRRRRLAAMAGTVYRAGVAAASEIREQYNNSSWAREGEDGGDGSSGDTGLDDDRPPSIPGAFPDVAIATSGDAQMILFPNYSMRHTRRFRESGVGIVDLDSNGGNGLGLDDGSMDWHYEFARREDEKAVVDVYVHGWIYLPQRGPLNRKNRLLVGLARRLSGITAAQQQQQVQQQAALAAQQAGEQQRIAREAAAIERRGQGEKEVATRGGYSETAERAAQYDDDEMTEAFRLSSQTGFRSPSPSPSPPTTTTTTTNSPATEMSEAELARANTNLMARLSPFLTTPVVQQAVTLFFYSATQSQSRTLETSDAGHFSACTPLDFVPTHVRVLVPTLEGGNWGSGGGANGTGYGTSNGTGYGSRSLSDRPLSASPLSAVAPVNLVEDRGVSLISDIDDTIKTSNIALGTREIFRNTFVRELDGMAVDGTQTWYGQLRRLGVQFHYCSNSPWQLFPMLATFLACNGLPAGPLHLKQYSGMLQGIFEPVAERKRATLERILRDFPQRRFLLVGDSGEADLEVYTELVQAHPGRVLAIFIRDVTTPEQPASLEVQSQSQPQLIPPPPPPPPPPQPRPPPGPIMGTLIDLDDDPGVRTASPASSLRPPGSRKPVPPPRPKPAALRGSMTVSSPSVAVAVSPASRPLPPPPPPPRRTATAGPSGSPVLGPQSQRPPRRVRTGGLEHPSPPLGQDVPRIQALAQEALPARTQTPPTQTPNRKVDLWRRRLARAEDVLIPLGVALYTWRRGQDVAAEAVGIVRTALDMR
ncbi:ATP-dependent RNA helicase [Grosmannia clavigera kw1407]|uniref:ATP-dependent RNA helicase n=1 Tax=Grosmannia clavigera (strain kw1407 / UAMH 11150) TaxID=655863 RepID=F0XQB9_GROCL|nr:ATP-dependent RNA helicase [Grosmannia clavigera kw1407]EFX00649.1 ATP-dependent RNA helicase [Grosmannia clavigera kw1407]